MLILGSQSPRRRELIGGLDRPFRAVSIDADESYPTHLQGGDIPLFISRAKARAYEGACEDGDILLTADTIVWLEGKVLGKPSSAADAIDMLRALSGHTHQVYTGVCILRRQAGQWIEKAAFVDCTDVTFRELTDDEIAYYVDKYQPLDKAGAYGVQEWIGYVAVTALKGSFYNVMGLPVERVYEALKQLEEA